MNEPKELRKEIGKVLKSWLEAHDISQVQVARDLDVSPAYVSGLCAGKTIGKRMASKLADLYGLSEAFLLTGRGFIDGDAVSSSSRGELFERAIQKSKRLTQILDYLVAEGKIESPMSAAHALDVTSEALQKAMKYDPEGLIDEIMVKLHNLYHVNLSWFLSGEGDMIEVRQKTTEAPMRISIDALLKDNEEIKDSIASFRRESERKYESLMHELSNSLGSFGSMAAEELSAPK